MREREDKENALLKYETDYQNWLFLVNALDVLELEQHIEPETNKRMFDCLLDFKPADPDDVECAWKEEDLLDGAAFTTACGERVDPPSGAFRFCHCCGRPVVIQEDRR